MKRKLILILLVALLSCGAAACDDGTVGGADDTGADSRDTGADSRDTGADSRDTDTSSQTDTDTSSDTDGGSEDGVDTSGTDTNDDTETGLDVDAPSSSVKTTVGVVSGGALALSSNYRLRVTIGGPPMAAAQSTNYSAVLGGGVLVNQ